VPLTNGNAFSAVYQIDGTHVIYELYIVYPCNVQISYETVGTHVISNGW
jgi:hypothetical protein